MIRYGAAACANRILEGEEEVVVEETKENSSSRQT